MAETHPKRLREEAHTEDYCEDSKRYKSYDQFLSSILDDEELDEPTQDLSDIFSTFLQELSSDHFPHFDPLPDPSKNSDPYEESTILSAASDYSPSSSSSQANSALNQNEEDEKERVIRHLLEASDDELGIPHRVDGGDVDEVVTNGGDGSFNLCDELWEIEDEAANYDTLLQSDLFM